MNRHARLIMSLFCGIYTTIINSDLLHQVLPFKENRYKWKITSEMLCTYCNEPESFIHFLLTRCRQVAVFWEKNHRLVMNLFQKDIVLGEEFKKIIIGFNIDDAKSFLTVCNL